MGYLEDEVKRLHTVLGNVEGRLKALEERQFGKPSGKTAEEIRMILIGPPGAGELDCQVRLRHDNLTLCRQGHTGTKDQGEVLLLSSGRPVDNLGELCNLLIYHNL
jgi:hypothetical protein